MLECRYDGNGRWTLRVNWTCPPYALRRMGHPAAYLVDFAVQHFYRVCVSQIVEGCNMKVLKCGDLNPGCSFVAKGKDENEVLQQAAQHAKADHGIATIPPDMLSAVRGAIHEEK